MDRWIYNYFVFRNLFARDFIAFGRFFLHLTVKRQNQDLAKILLYTFKPLSQKYIFIFIFNKIKDFVDHGGKKQEMSQNWGFPKQPMNGKKRNYL